MTENWKEIHEDFSEYYQQIWERRGLTYQDAQQWIPVGLKPDDYNFASYLKQNNITPERYTNYNTNYKNKSPQEQLDYFYADKNQVEEIYLKYLNFNQPSELTINDYSNLKRINGYEVPNLTQLTITNCPQLERTDINNSKNNLTSLEINNCDNLQRIDCSNNKLAQIKLFQIEKLEILYLNNNNLNQDLSFLSGLVGLKELYLCSNPLYGSLEYLSGMSKLEWLNISNTDLDSGLEYSPDSLKYFYCSADERKNAKCKTLGKQLNFLDQGKEHYGYNLQEWKNANYKLIIKAQKELVEGKNKKIVQLEEQITKLNTKLSESSSNLPELVQAKKEIEELSQFKSFISPKYSQLRDYSQQLTVKYNSLQTQLSRLEETNQQLNNWKQKHSQDIKEKNTSLTELTEQNSQLEEEITQLKAQIEAKQQEITNNPNNQSLLEKLQKEKAELESKLVLKERELRELKKLVLQQLINQKQQELEEIKSDIKKGVNLHLVDMICQLQKEIDTLEYQLIDLLNEQLISSRSLSISDANWDKIITELKSRQQSTEQVEQTAQILQPNNLPGSSKNN